jgi:predicted outer membrane repeat protein
MFVISSVSATDLNSNDTSVETYAEDTVISTDVGTGSFSDLRSAIYSSNDIRLTGDITNNNEQQIVISPYKNITINGNGHTINGNNVGRIFIIYPTAELTLKNVKLINGNLPPTLSQDFDGGAILNMGTLTIENCEFNNNYARDGGAIACDKDAVTTIKGTNTFYKNSAWQDGGAIVNGGGSTLFITGKNTFDSNNAYYKGSAAISIDEGKGGAIMNAFASEDDAKKKSYLYIEGETIFKNNVVYADGGAIFNHQAIANLTGKATFIGNKAMLAQGKGGAINNEDGTFYLSGTNTFQSNEAYRGGAIDTSLFGSTMTISGKNEFTNNRASMGGAISNQEGVRLNIYGENTFVNNKANFASGPNIGGAIYSFRAYLNIDANNIFNQNSALGSGGAIYNANNNFVMKGTNSFNQNSAPMAGAILLIDSQRVEFSGENVFYSNSATSSGGAIRANNVKELILSNHNYFSNNKASHSGGAIYMQNSALDTKGSSFEGNTAQYGGAIFLENTVFAGNYNIFKNNYASATGSDIESYQSSINSLEYNYWNSQNKVSQNNIHNYDVGKIKNWAILDLTIPSQIKQNTNTEIVKFKTNSYGNLNGAMPKYSVSATPNFNPSTVLITNNVGESKYTGGIGQTTVSVSSSNFAASKTVNVVEGRIKTTLSGNNIILNDPSQSANYEVTLSDANGNKLSGKTITITVDGKKETKTTNNQGKASLTLTNLANGYHEVVSTYSGESKYYDSTTTNSIVCLFNNETKNKLTGKDVEMYYKDGSKYEVKLTDANNNPLANKVVKIYINGNVYERTTNNEGKASIAINLNSGNITILAFYPDKDFAFCENNVYIKSTISGNDLVKYYRNASQYHATFLNTNGQLLKNTKIKFNINGVLYERTTNDKGVAQMNINLPPNTYTITAINPVNGEMHSNKITVLGIFKGNDLTKYYRNDSQYYITILGGDGNPVGAGETVKFNINGVFYERKTNESGIAKMNINLPPNTYTITAEYNQLRYSNTIKVLPVLEGKNVVMKYRDGSKFEAKLVDGQGKPSANKVISFNVNGVFYNKTTDSSGIARLNINLMAGEYIITSMYETARASNKITIYP